jgi:hypothetical protein
MEMTQSRLVLAGLVAAAALGVIGNAGTPSSSSTQLMRSDIVIAADDAAPSDAGAAEDSAKMGKEEGTHTGSDLGATPENDTSKIDQPARRNVPSNSTDDKAAPGQ